MAVMTILYHDYFLTLPDEVRIIFARGVSLLTSSRCGMRGKGGSRGVRYLRSERSVHSN